MLLAVDIGNTSTSLGIFIKNKLIFTYNIPTSSDFKKTYLHKKIISVCNNNDIRVDHLTNIGISSVVPAKNNFWRELNRDYFKLLPHFVTYKSKTSIKLKIDNPKEIGADRICNAVAGYELFKRRENIIVIDFGTATTYDVVLKNGDYIGGIIAPGIETLSQSLHQRTAKLPLLIPDKHFVFPRFPIGRNTLEAMQAGLMYSSLDSMERMVQRVEKSLKSKFKIVLTGGLSNLISKRTKYKVTHKKFLVLW
ncbi:MAG: type III pantothenate kinase, partial [Ignavibacteria bacterium]